MSRPLVALLVLAACGGKEETPAEELPAYITLTPADGLSNISPAARVQAVISREDGEHCRFEMSETTVTVTRNGVDVPGNVVFFIDGLRVDFTPSGLFDYGASYDVEVATACSATAASSFSTVADAASAPMLAVGDAMRSANLEVSEPQAIAPLLQGFLGDASILFGVTGFDEHTIGALGGEGRELTDLDFPGLYVYKRKAFLFPMVGVLKWPYFQIEGTLTINIVEDRQLTLDHFEIAGQLVGESPNLEIVNGILRASAPCDDVCAVEDNDLQLICANPSTICDGAGILNMVGSFDAPTNDIRPYQVVSLSPADGAGDVATDAPIVASFTRAVPIDDGAALFVVTDAGGTAVTGTITQAGDGLSATFTPTVPLAAHTDYSVIAVAQGFAEASFTTGN